MGGLSFYFTKVSWKHVNTVVSCVIQFKKALAYEPSYLHELSIFNPLSIVISFANVDPFIFTQPFIPHGLRELSEIILDIRIEITMNLLGL